MHRPGMTRLLADLRAGKVKAGVTTKALQSFTTGNSAAKSLGPVPSTGPGECLRTTLFLSRPALQKSGGATCARRRVGLGVFVRDSGRRKKRRH
jgi:hypothetical protein